ncbi:MAG: hypothetical protein AB8F94_10820 [Saprospiraceae bacterium]
MKQPIGVLFLFISFLFVFQSCKKDTTIEEILPEEKIVFYSNIPAPLWSYFKNFEEEALLRGFQIDLEAQHISAKIMEIVDDGVAGSCTYGSHQPGHIIIDESFWNQSNDNWKEMVIFHELGHCSLHRGHREDANLDGTCISIMRSGIEDCRDNYQYSTRATYLDELFGIEN